jgi:hypothetical protein
MYDEGVMHRTRPRWIGPPGERPIRMVVVMDYWGGGG